MKHVLIMAVAGWAGCLTLTAAVCLPREARGADADRPDKPSVVAEIYGKPEPTQEGETPDEAALIEAALVAQGYFRADVPLDYSLQDALHTACEANNVPYHVALGLIEVESGFNLEAVGTDGKDIGLFQIRTSNHAWLSAETGANPMMPEGNIECGVWLLGYLLGRYETTDAALTAYRWGHDNGDREYANMVLRAAEIWKEALSG